MTDGFVVYSKIGCGYCDKIVQLLEIKNIPYVKYTLHEDFTKLDFFNQFGRTSFPRVTHNGELVGGASETAQYLVDNGYV